MVYEAGGDGVVLDTLNTHYETDEDGVVPNTQVRAWSMRLMEMGWFVIQQVRARRGPNTCSSRDRKCLHCISDPSFYSFPAASNREPCSRTPPHIGLQTACTHRTRGCWRVEGRGGEGEGRGRGRGGEGRGGEGEGELPCNHKSPLWSTQRSIH